MKFNQALKVLVSCLVISLFVGVVLVMAQEQPPPPPGGGRNFDPAQMQARMLERSTTNLKLTAEESKVIMPKIEALMNYRFSSMQELQPLRQDLRDLVDSGKATDKAIKQVLDKFKAKATEIKKKTEDMENGLKAVLTVQQEAQLTLNGIITNGVAGGFGGGRGMGGPGGFGGGRGGRGGNNGGGGANN
jgi:Spy/CpxP family protein refolding chaperone